MASVSKAEYLKKYLSDNQDGDKKKKRRKKVKLATRNVKRSRIIDDDVNFESLLPSNLGNTLEEDVGDHEPTVADVVDDRPDNIVLLEQFRQDERWKILGNKTKKYSENDGKQKNFSRRHDSDSDESPPRKQRHDSDSDQSPQRKQRYDSESDRSPPRKQRHDSDSDQSHPRKQRHDSDSDQSPPRRQRQDSDSDQSPPRRQQKDSDSDQSPPRKHKRHSESDQSPPRRRKHSDSDQSPPRRSKHASSNRSSPRKKEYADNDRSHSSSRTQKSKVQEKSKERKKSRWGSDEETLRENKAKALAAIEDVKGRATKTLGGATAGLSSAKQMKEEAIQMRERDDKMFNTLDEASLGRNATTVFRQKGSGRRRNFEEEKELTAEEEAKLAEKAEKYKAWNKGLKQATLQSEAVEDALYEMSKPLTRRRDDEDLDAALKAQDREGDPMLAFIKKKKTGKDSKKKELPRYKGPQPPPNRFHIWPGYRWDGVDRSNGFEKKVFAKVSEKKAVKEIAYKWSVEDM